MSIIYEPKGRAKEYALLAINHYRGCAHGCAYCYVRKLAQRFKWDCDEPEPHVNVDELEKEAQKLSGTTKRILLSFMSDPYPLIDAGVRYTRKVIKTLKRYNLPIMVLTKAGTQAVDDFDLYTPGDVFSVTLTTRDPMIAHLREPGAAPPYWRYEAMKIAKRDYPHIETHVSLEPVIDPDEAIGVVRYTHEYTDVYKVGPLNHFGRPQFDLRDFGVRFIHLMERFGKRYYIKTDLAKHLEGIEYHNTETRYKEDARK